MAALYWFAVIVGGGLLAASLFGDLFGTDVDAERGDTDAAKILSLRTLTYFLFGFGATGLVLGWLGSVPRLVLAVVALAAGIAAAGAASLLLGYVGKTGTGDRVGDESFVGCKGRLVLPFAADRPGRVMVQRGTREYELRARPFDEAASATPVGGEVLVIEMEGGTAKVGRLEAFPALWGGDA